MKQLDTKYNEAVQLIKSAILHNQLEAAKAVNRQPLAGDLDWHEFLSLSFSHHYEILAKTDTLEECAFYIHQKVLPPEEEMRKLLFANGKTNEDKEG